LKIRLNAAALSALDKENGSKLAQFILDYTEICKQRDNQDGSFILFKKTKTEYDARRQQQQQYFGKRSIYRTVQVQILPIEQANQLLEMTKDFELVDRDPIKS
jgi:hypothetical protein